MRGIVFWKPLDIEDKALRFICVQRIRDDEIDHNLSSGEEEVLTECFKVVKGFDIDAFSGTDGFINVFRNNDPVARFVLPIHWTGQKFYVKGFCSGPSEEILYNKESIG